MVVVMESRNLEIFINERGPYLGELRVETEQIDVTMAGNTYKPDPQWTYVDKAGHFHALTGDGRLPTLVSYEKHLNCDGSCAGVCSDEGYTETRYRCAICRKRVKPGYAVEWAGGVPRSIPGRTSWTVRIAHPESLGLTEADVAVRAVAGQRTMFGLARRHMTARNEAEFTYEFHGITELGRRP